MSNLEGIVNLTEQYARHKWALRRILLTGRSFEDLSEELKIQFPAADILPHEIDSMWFSRTNKGSETWELRRIGSPPFALVEVIDDALSAEERENRLASVELEMANHGLNARGH